MSWERETETAYTDTPRNGRYRCYDCGKRLPSGSGPGGCEMHLRYEEPTRVVTVDTSQGPVTIKTVEDDIAQMRRDLSNYFMEDLGRPYTDDDK